MEGKKKKKKAGKRLKSTNLSSENTKSKSDILKCGRTFLDEERILI